MDEEGDGSAALTDDRTARARLRDAAIALVAEHGSSALTARAVAERAELSAGLIRHHFGSMAKLEQACDDHVVALIREQKTSAMAQGTSFDMLQGLRSSGNGDTIRYLAHRLVEGSGSMDHLVDMLVDDAERYLEVGVEHGVIHPSAQPRTRAVMLSLFSLGSLVLNRHSQRLLGLDLGAPDLQSEPGIVGYMNATIELFTQGLLTDEAAAAYETSLNAEEQGHQQ